MRKVVYKRFSTKQFTKTLPGLAHLWASKPPGNQSVIAGLLTMPLRRAMSPLLHSQAKGVPSTPGPLPSSGAEKWACSRSLLQDACGNDGGDWEGAAVGMHPVQFPNSLFPVGPPTSWTWTLNTCTHTWHVLHVCTLFLCRSPSLTYTLVSLV